MQQQTTRSAQRSRRVGISLIARIILFIVTLLAVIVTGVLADMTGATSPATALSGALAVILGIVAVIQIYPILFPTQSAPITSTGNSSPSSTNSVQGANGTLSTGAKTGQSIFLFNMPLRDPNEFYGRIAERTTLIIRTANGGSSSIVGERRSGKTWLLDYLQLVAPTHGTLGPAYRVGCVSATHPQSKSLANFVRRALEELKVPQHSVDLSLPPLGQLSRGVRDLKEQGIRPVLCIDEFEGFANRQEFNNDFVEGLRALAQDDGLVLVTVSKRPLKELIEDLTGQTSPLFNIVQQMRLHPFTEQEAREFVRAKSEEADFDERECGHFLRWATLYNTNGEPYWPPLRLQLVGQMLLDDKQTAQGSPAGYQLDDIRYQSEFTRRLDETYQAVVRRA